MVQCGSYQMTKVFQLYVVINQIATQRIIWIVWVPLELRSFTQHFCCGKFFIQSLISLSPKILNPPISYFLSTLTHLGFSNGYLWYWPCSSFSFHCVSTHSFMQFSVCFYVHKCLRISLWGLIQFSYFSSFISFTFILSKKLKFCIRLPNMKFWLIVS